MHQPLAFELLEQHFWLSPNRYIFWEEEKALIVSDLHFGKTGHFRKSGIAVPQNIFKEDLQRLLDGISFFKPEQIIAVGDLFHSHANKELDLFLKWRNDFTAIHFHLIKGNHDILKDEWYATANLKTTKDVLTISSFNFVHDINHLSSPQADSYSFSGHIHPGISLKGVSKQSLHFPCFYFSSHYAVLPAYSRFTGSISVKASKKIMFLPL